MPLYEYACRQCDHSFEALVFSGGADVTCPKCQSRQVDQQLGLPARPRTEATALPTACNPNLPPCGPACCRLNGDD